jgi:hypothetical protein
MTCRRCGCRMLTKVGRATPMLICTDCGRPVDQRETAELKRKRLWGAITLMGMAVLGAATFLLASMNEMRRAATLEGAYERQGEASGEGAGEDRPLLEPSGLWDLQQPSAVRAGASSAESKPAKGQDVKVSAKPGAVETQDNKEH